VWKSRQHQQLARVQVSALSDQQEKWKNALRVQRVPQDVRSAVKLESASENALWREAVQMQDVREEFHAVGPLAKTQLRTYR